ncbi:diacylglycerol kinase family enzyme [Catenuloplanes nepalensis]|uniref:Diacylglycerol kinase family enzyme n=1 Tax=Catenuloplanes nepalensis TaxID=587533 RepID=A0ABT9MV30_9ACTN|nr:diacylglycerol kinase family protein [Catenuloplanes nepalensis]MDP9795283.1 diacylglycerol kinase family enzyme [Catenuloplanes nepalensis]
MRTPVSAVVVNPAKVADLGLLRSTITDTLAAAGWAAPMWLETTVDDPGAGQAGAAVRDGAEVVLVCGGDGTVMSCVTALAGTGVAMAVLPAGTGNLLAANLGLTGDLATGIEVVLQGGRRLIDVGTAGDQSFAVMAGMGFDAHMLDATNDTAKKHLGWLAYLGGAVQHLRGRQMRLQITLDDRPSFHRRARSVIVGNVGRLQGGMRLLHDAQPDDGLLDIAILSPRTLWHWATLGWGLLLRKRSVARMEILTAARIDIRASRTQPRQLDGDLIAPGDRLLITVRPNALLLCVPQPATDPDLAHDAGAAARDAALREPVRA